MVLSYEQYVKAVFGHKDGLNEAKERKGYSIISKVVIMGVSQGSILDLRDYYESKALIIFT